METLVFTQVDMGLVDKLGNVSTVTRNKSQIRPDNPSLLYRYLLQNITLNVDKEV
jgi:hypothetical protein